MISARQIKAARALLDWTQNQLAQAAGMHLNAINKIENEDGNPHRTSLERIQNILESSGVQFRGTRGVEIREDIFQIKRFEGRDYIQRLIDDALSIVNTEEDEILTCISDEQLFNLADKKQNDRYYRQMKRVGFKERYIMSHKHKNFMNPDVKVYRWLPEKTLGTVAYAVYGDRTVFINWKTSEILIIRSKSLSTTFKGQFEFLWNQAKPFNV